MKNNKNQKKSIIIMVMVLVFFIAMLFLMPTPSVVTDVTYPEFMKMVEDEKVTKVDIDLKKGKFVFEDKEEALYNTDNPKTENFKEFLLLNNIEVTEIETNNSSGILINLIQLCIYGAFIMFLLKRMMPPKNNDEAVANIPNITFNDIAGEKELKKDLQFVIEYLKNPKKYEEMGARMPKGIILYGPPGTGKTLTARAIAGTAGVPFFSVSGSDFVEMYVGLGAKRVRDLYKKARLKAPCIIFVDEIDAIGGERGSKASHSENNQTVNAFLNELDGFNGSEGVLTICATNMVGNLDPALVRPGRFDKQLAVPMPEREDRLEILKIHARGKKISDEVDFAVVANMTVGFSGASLESMLNEAAFLAVNENKQFISMEEIDHAFYKLVMKGDRKENQTARDKDELRLVAWHEAGHALATKIYTGDSVPKVTIIASTSGAGGVTFRNPKEMTLLSKKYIQGVIKTMYAGRAAEYCFTNDRDLITTGASNDIKQATNVIKDYISIYGMDEKYGMLSLSEFQQTDSEEFINQAAKLSKTLYEATEKDIMEYKDVISEIADYLLENESMNEAEFDDILKKHNVKIGGVDHEV